MTASKYQDLIEWNENFYNKLFDIFRHEYEKSFSVFILETIQKSFHKKRCVFEFH